MGGYALALGVAGATIRTNVLGVPFILKEAGRLVTCPLLAHKADLAADCKCSDVPVQRSGRHVGLVRSIGVMNT